MLKYFLSYLKKDRHIELNSRVSFQTRLGEEYGIVKGVSKNKARVVSYATHSSFSQWIPIHKLQVID